MLHKEFATRNLGTNNFCEWMTYIVGVDAALAKPGLFEGEKTKELVDPAADYVDTALAPSPDLWSNQVENRNPETLQVARETEMKSGLSVSRAATGGCRST